jgi:hypothetical protein
MRCYHDLPLSITKSIFRGKRIFLKCTKFLFLKEGGFMIIASNIEEIENAFDFTDSIITGVKWANHLTDLSISVDYYCDIQDGKSETRELTLVFKDCLKAEFSMPSKFI